MVRAAGKIHFLKNLDRRRKNRALPVCATIKQVAGKIHFLKNLDLRRKRVAPPVCVMIEQAAGGTRKGGVLVQFQERPAAAVPVVAVSGGVNVPKLNVRRLNDLAQAAAPRCKRVYVTSGAHLGTGVPDPCATPTVVLVLKSRYSNVTIAHLDKRMLPVSAGRNARQDTKILVPFATPRVARELKSTCSNATIAPQGKKISPVSAGRNALRDTKILAPFATPRVGRELR